MLQISVHGGKCCGVKHIHSFPAKQKDFEPSLKAWVPANKYQHSPFAQHDNTSCGENYFLDKAPREHAVNRLKRYVKYLRKKHPKHLVVATLADTLNSPYAVGPTWQQTSEWREPLEKLGFKEVTKFINSNTNRTIYVFHLVIGE